MRHGLRREIDKEPRRKAKVGRRGSRQFSSGGSGALSSASIVGKEQSNQLKAVAQTSTPSGRSGSTFYQGCGYQHYGQCKRSGTFLGVVSRVTLRETIRRVLSELRVA